jgi:DNA-binding CsgD family transcriptional regulator
MPAIALFVKELPLECSKKVTAGELPCTSRLEQTLYKAAKTMGFEYVRYTCWHKEVDSGDSFPMSFSINFSNFPKVWEKNYEARQYYLHDPVLRALEAAGQNPVVSGTWQAAWCDAEAKSEDAHYLERIRELSVAAAQHGINGGFYMMLVTGLSRFVISLGSSRVSEDIEKQAAGNLQQQVFALVTLLGQAMALTRNCNQCSKPLRVQGGASVTLTPRQAKVLEAFAENSGATNVDVAKISHVTTETVAFHLKAIRKKFNRPSASGHALSNIAKLHGLI